jgi:hypothetical protein
MAHHWTLAYHQTLWQIFLNSSPFWMIWNIVGQPSQALKMIFEMQRSSQTRAIKKIHFFKLQIAFFWFIFTLPTSSVHNFIILFLVQIEWFKLLWNRHLKLYKSCSNSKGNRVIFKDFLRGLKIGYELFDQEFFCNNDLLYLGGSWLSYL